MSKAIRQENLYGAEGWSTIYTSFKNAEFTSYDFDTLRQSMLNYMQIAYAEEFNDYTQNSEFIALLDLVAFVGQNLAFRTDLNARENILDTAEKRESVLRIARMLSYKPKRVLPAQGLLKVVSILTTENILDSTGYDLSNKSISWGSDPSELEYERFVRVMNSAFDSTNQFGTPVNRQINSTTGDLFETYNFNNSDSMISRAVSVYADGSNLAFDLLPVTFDTDGNIAQATPDHDAAFSVMYRNDGRGVGSTRTGFFVLIKQGFMTSKDIKLTGPESNLVVDLENTASVSEYDFYVQTVNSNASVLKNWTRVDTVNLNNIVVNDFGVGNKDLYEVIYSDADITSIKFGDGSFTNAPTGNIKIWYRIADNSYVRIKAGEISSIPLVFDYKNSQGQTHSLQLTLELQDNMSTGIPSESLAEIKNNAPETFYSKNRMVTGDDYNGLIPTLNNDVLLSKSENRTFAGHTRYVDLKDPTGKNRPLIEFADDGYIYKQAGINNIFVADSGIRRSVDFINQYIQSQLGDIGMLNFYYGNLNLNFDRTNTMLFPVVDQVMFNSMVEYRWNTAYYDTNSSNGFIYTVVNGQRVPQRLGYATTGFLRNIKPGSLVKFSDDNNNYQWVTILDVRGDGAGNENLNGTFSGLLTNGNGTIEINKAINSSARIVEIIPPLPRVFDETTVNAIKDKLDNKEDFSILFDNTVPSWSIVTDTADLYYEYDSSDNSTAWVINVTRNSENNGWSVLTRKLDYIFGSDALIRFYNVNFAPSFNINFKNVSTDTINVLGLDVNGKIAIKQTYTISGYYTSNDGYTDNSKVKITPLDLNNDFLPDDPSNFNSVVGDSKINLINYLEGDFSYVVPDTTTPGVVPGATKILFKWIHNVGSDQTLNPSLTNIIDCYVLTKTYNEDFISWKRSSSTPADAPLPPTSEELRNNFKNLTKYKMLTDEIIFHPASFKPLFGALADPEFQAQFKVVKSVNSKLTDNEIKTKVIQAIDGFFTPGNFDFGEIFYFTELAAYIHTALTSDLNSVVLVPVNVDSKFGTLFQIQPNRDELVTSVASVNDVIVVNELTDKNIRIGR
jgi:hypothetical protein